ncbi:MAG: fasciclin domain-containing protein, partial [Pseudomonadota bacterium]
MIKTISIAAVSALALAACSTTGDTTVAAASTDTTSSAAVETAERAPVTIGGAEMLPTNTIVENAVLSNDHKTLVSALQAAELVDTLSG